MSTREDIERTLREAYAARQRGDLDEIGIGEPPPAHVQHRADTFQEYAALFRRQIGFRHHGAPAHRFRQARYKRYKTRAGRHSPDTKGM